MFFVIFEQSEEGFEIYVRKILQITTLHCININIEKQLNIDDVLL
jgi:hypothetical protein